MERTGVLQLIDVHKRLSHEAADAFADRSLDFVFIDASHELDEVRQDLAAWWPKMRSGGLFAGHDYADYVGGDPATAGKAHPGVKQAVDEFAASLGLTIRISRASWLLEVP